MFMRTRGCHRPSSDVKPTGSGLLHLDSAIPPSDSRFPMPEFPISPPKPAALRRVQNPPLRVEDWLAERLPFADADGTIGRDVVPPSSFNSFLLARRGNPGTLGTVAPRAGSDKILQASGSAFGPRVEVVAVLGRA